MKSKGIVYLVGAGPGDTGLFTLRGAELLRHADVVIYDALANPELLRLAPPGAELIARGKNMSMPQSEITSLLITHAKAGKKVVRLKGGDPFVFGRGAEEAEALAAENIPFEIVPGVSSITAVPNYAGIPLTHRDHCSSFTVFTGHSDAAEAATALRYDQIAKIPGTKVVLMGTEKLEEWTAALIANGMPAQTPIAIIHRGTTGRQKTVAGTLSTIAGLAAKQKITPPALTIIGDVVKLRDKLNWFERLPLFGKRIVVTRRKGQTGRFAMSLADLGADVLQVPTIRITQPTERDAIVDAFMELNGYEWLIFTSVNGVEAFFEYFFKRFKDLRDIGGARIAAVGPATAAKLQELHLQVDLMPEQYNTKKIIEAFKKYQDIENVKMCLFRAEVATPELPKALIDQGAIVDDIAIYKTVSETEDPTGAAERLAEEGADWITFTSASTVEHFHARFDLPKLVKKFPGLKLASIGPETTKAIQALKLEPTIEAKEHSTDGLLAALTKAAGK